MQVARHTLKARRQERIAKSVIWAFVLLTLAMLAWIVLYVLVRGFYSDRNIVYPVVDMREEQIVLSVDDVPQMTVIAHKGVRVKDLTLPSLRILFTKRRVEKWGPYTEQNMRVYPVAFTPAPGFGAAARSFIVGPEEDYEDYVTFVDNARDMVAEVAANKGAVGFIPYSEDLSLKGVRVVPIRRISTVVHPSVREIVNNVQLQQLTESDIQRIYTGEVTNWTELGGVDLPIVPVLPPGDDEYFGVIRRELLEIVSQDELGDNVYVADTATDFCDRLKTTRGAVGLCFYDRAQERELLIVDMLRHETGWNLDIPFLLEAPARSGAWGGISTIIINTLVLIVFTLLFSTPIGVFAAIYLVEYPKQGRLMSVLRMGTETLAGIPSIVFGLFGNIFFVNMLGMGIGFISSTLTVTMMILPTIVRTSEEALKSVPMSYREGSLALGATKLQTIFKVVVPAAIPGILTGIILGVGRVVGETAVLLYTLGSNYELVRGPSSSARVLSLHLYFLFSEAISFERAFATGAILIFIILIVNFATTRLISRVNRMSGRKKAA